MLNVSVLITERNEVCWCTAAIPARRRLRRKGRKLKVSFSYTIKLKAYMSYVRPYRKIKCNYIKTVVEKAVETWLSDEENLLLLLQRT